MVSFSAKELKKNARLIAAVNKKLSEGAPGIDLIDGGKTFRDFIRANKDSQRLIKKLIKDVSGTAVPIGPYEPKSAGKTVSNAEQSLRALEKLGLDVSIEDSARKTRS